MYSVKKKEICIYVSRRCLSINEEHRRRVIKAKREKNRCNELWNTKFVSHDRDDYFSLRPVTSRRDATRRDASQPRPRRSIFIVMDGPYNGRTRRVSPVKDFLLKDLSPCPCLDIAARQPRDDCLTNEMNVTNKSKASSRTSLCLATRRDRETRPILSVRFRCLGMLEKTRL